MSEGEENPKQPSIVRSTARCTPQNPGGPPGAPYAEGRHKREAAGKHSVLWQQQRLEARVLWQQRRWEARLRRARVL